MELLNLEPSRVSLGFTAEEWPVVAQRLQQFGVLEREQLATLDRIRIGPENFILVDDDERLVLISRSAIGDLWLKRVFHNLGPGSSASLRRNSFRAGRQISQRCPRRAA